MKISVHPLFFAFGLYFALTGKVFLFLNFTLTALIHEIGHATACEKLGYKINKISLMPYGAVVNGAIEGLSYKDEVKVALAGPLANLCVCILFTCFFWLVPQFYPYLQSVVFSSLCVFTINLLPAYPLDGGRVLSATLSLFLPRKKSMLIVKIAGVVIALALLGVFVYSIIIKAINFSLLFFSLFLLVGALKKTKENAYVRAFYCHAVSPFSIKECKNFVVGWQILLKDLIAVVNKENLLTLEIRDDNCNRTLYLNSAQSTRLISSYRLYESVGLIASEMFKSQNEKT